MPMHVNLPPTVFTRVAATALRDYAYAILRHIDMPKEQAELLARLLVDSDLRGVHSHGTWQLARYISEIRSGGLNLRPDIRVVSETPAVLVLDGDGGLGYTPAWMATEAAIRKALATGLGAATTRHHGHFGAVYRHGAGLQLPAEPGEARVAHADACPVGVTLQPHLREHDEARTQCGGFGDCGAGFLCSATGVVVLRCPLHNHCLECAHLFRSCQVCRPAIDCSTTCSARVHTA